MKSKKIIALTASAFLSIGIIGSISESQNVDAATMRTKRMSYVYNSKGHRTKKKIRKGKHINAISTKKIKGKRYWRIGRNKYVRFNNVGKLAKAKKHVVKTPDDEKYEPTVVKHPTVNLDNHPSLPEAKTLITNADKLPAGTRFEWENKPEFTPKGETEGTIKVIYPDNTTDEADVSYTFHGTNHIIIPASYTADEIKASEDTPTSTIVKASEEGMDNNIYISESEKDDNEKVNYRNLTTAQKEEISQFALRLINEVRTKLNRPSWHYSALAQKLADDVADEYQENGRGIQDDDHYVPGLSRAAAKNGLDIGGINQIEDMYGSTTDKPETMYDLKGLAFYGIINFLFNGDELHHAADITSCHQDSYWNSVTQNSPFAISFTHVGDWNSVHYISIPSNVLNNN